MSGIPRVPTTREIATACGVSQCTVSLALRDNPEIASATRMRIQATARHLGWKPNPMAAAYMGHLRSTRPTNYRASIAFLVSHPTSGEVQALPRNQILLYEGALRRAEELGYHLEPVWLHEKGMTPTRLGQILKNRGIPGIIIPGIQQPDDPRDLWENFDWASFASVKTGVEVTTTPLSCVLCDMSRAIEMALQKLTEYRYRRIAMVVSRHYDQRLGHGLLYPFYFWQQEHSRNEWIKSHIFSKSRAFERDGKLQVEATLEVRQGIRRWLEQKRPEVVIGEAVVWQVLEEMKWRVPEDIAFVSPDWCARFPQIAGIDQRDDIIGAAAVDVVSAQLMQNERGIDKVPKILMVRAQWQPGQSVPTKPPTVATPKAFQ